MKEIVKKVYKCEYCNKLYQIKSACEKHEKICIKNPENSRPCFDCKRLIKKEQLFHIGDDYMGGEVLRTLKLFYCKAKEYYLYTPQNKIKNNYFDLGEYLNEPMPKKCDKFRHYDYMC